MKAPTSFRELLEQRAEYECRLHAALVGWDSPFAAVPTRPLSETRPEAPKPPTESQRVRLLEALDIAPEVGPAATDRLARALGAR